MTQRFYFVSDYLAASFAGMNVIYDFSKVPLVCVPSRVRLISLALPSPVFTLTPLTATCAPSFTSRVHILL